MSDTRSDDELLHGSALDDIPGGLDGVDRSLRAVDDRPALDVDPGDAGYVQEDDDVPPVDEHQGEGDDDE